ncbi:glucan 1,3-beta-glucosidase [Auricularia subglabra TFB-10046 SS5]|uniref:Glucan 1,3-beta-glucosidase n=1 Tax=Auricularia subglabra (strain TFB-10046 / SS5) TaxID=717982 RepID=J0WXN2_AURST|nr:glucan 1,3-beta-glucosidase [Auricularia subglabra TFB-10046 SS5]
MVLSPFIAIALLACAHVARSIGTACSAPLGRGSAGPGDPYWLENMPKRGSSAYNADPASYVVRRNVRDFGARGDGVTDDTQAINNAMTSGGRCGLGCGQSTRTPAVVYLPPGTYKISSPIILYWYTAMVGDARNPPSLLAAANFSGIGLIDADPYTGGNGGAEQYYANQNNFYRSLRNLVIDMRQLPVQSTVNGLHWQVSQSTSISNLRIEMSRDPATGQVGMFMENGSGGYMGDMVINGGAVGLNLGNQQFTVRNVAVNGAQTAIMLGWSWTWLFYHITITDCPVGFRLSTGSTTSRQATGSSIIADSTFTNVHTAVQTTTDQAGSYASGFVLDNVVFNGVTRGVADMTNNVALAGGSTSVLHWIQGSVYAGSNSTFRYLRAAASALHKPSVLLEDGKFVSRPRPQYENYAVGDFVSVKALGAKGDGTSDDTAILNAIFAKYAGCKIIFFDAGSYVVTSTLTIPAGSQVIGEAWSTIIGTGPKFSDPSNPQVVVRVGTPGSNGILEISDMLFTTRGPAGGAIVVEWNVHDPAGRVGVAGVWETVIRLGGAAGTNLQAPNCPIGNQDAACMAAFLGLHLTTHSNGYFEGLWVWTADHDVDNGPQVNIYSGRGILSESQGPVWLVGTGSEHNAIVQYNFAQAKNHFLGVIQTESPYWQPSPAAPAPFTLSGKYFDPTSFGPPGNAWALRISNSSGILVYGAGLYSFFNNYWADGCGPQTNCQNQIASVESSSNIVLVGLSTVGVTKMLTVDGSAIIDQADNRFGTQSTVMKWSH